MEPANSVLSCCIYIRALDITDEEKAQHEAKFKVWYEDFRKQHAEHFEKVK